MVTDRLLVTLLHLRTGLTHEALGVIYQVGSSMIGRATREIWPLLAEHCVSTAPKPRSADRRPDAPAGPDA